LPDAPVRLPRTVDNAPGATRSVSEQDAELLAEDVDLEPELRRRVLALHRDLAHLDHYALLGVDRAADRKALKRAYFELAAVFHPDKYFRKRLGSFKSRMEAVFSRATLAHDVLTGKESRAEYDAYLDEQRRLRGIEELISNTENEERRAVEAVEREVRAAEGAASPPGSALEPPPPPASAPRVVGPAVDAAARREALARRLLGGRARAQAPAGGGRADDEAPPPPRVSSPAEAVEALRRRYEERIARAKAAQARKYAQRADEALAAGDAVAAANALRVAAGLAPADGELQARSTEATSKADSLLGDTYTNQAQYEERHGQWAEAARSWTKASRGRPNDANTHERAANAIVKAGGDLHEARRLARRACELSPTAAQNRVTLAAVYEAAGHELSARRELEAAAQLAPQDGTIRAMLDKLAKST
jgi:curved DNA-binding protein CbpA